MKSLSITILCFLGVYALVAQQEFDPSFETFKGTAYKIPPKVLLKGYSKSSTEYDQIARLELSELNIPERSDEIPFENIPVSQGYGVIFHSKMEVKKTGSHVFDIESDDGSILWIDSKMVINNDKMHQMRLKSDTVYLEKGVYPIKIWYMQAIPDRYGLIFKAKYHSQEKLPHYKTFKKEVKKEVEKVFVFNDQILKFEYNSSELLDEGKQTLEAFSQQLVAKGAKRIQIIGHTDSQGSETYNYQLSLARANAVRDIIRANTQGFLSTIEVMGSGESKPIADNTTVEGRSLNRRVEIKVF